MLKYVNGHILLFTPIVSYYITLKIGRPHSLINDAIQLSVCIFVL